MLSPSYDSVHKAEWFLQLLNLLPPNTEGINIRMLHYLALNRDYLAKPDGTQYTNTIKDYEFLNYAYEQACLYSIVPYQKYDLIMRGEFINVQYNSNYKFAHDNSNLKNENDKTQSDVPFHVEVWMEDSLSASIVLPITERFNINFVAAAEPISLGMVFRFVRRLAMIKKPIRIFHLSDYTIEKQFDNTKNKLNLLLTKHHIENDIQIQHLALSKKQCDCLQLPVIPNENRIELNALEARCPGLIREVLTSHISRCRAG